MDAYRYTAASIRVRVIDDRFDGLPDEQRDGMVEPYLSQLDERPQADILMLLTFTPSEVERASTAPKSRFLNGEFEDPSPSLL